MSSKPLAFPLMAAGVLPFLAGALAPWIFPAADPAGIGRWFDAYALVIAAFMAGTLWGRGHPGENSERPAALAASNVIALALWVCAAATGGIVRDLLLAGTFLVLLAAEGALRPALGYSGPYRRWRVAVTGLVSACLLIHAAAWR